MFKILRSFIGPRSLLTQGIRRQLLENGQRRKQSLTAGGDDRDFLPVVKLFTPDANAVWLLTELDPDNADIAYGLCDLGMGYPELLHMSLTEIESVRGPSGLRPTRDVNFRATQALSAYLHAARAAEKIIEDEKVLYSAAAKVAADRSVSS